MTIEQKAQRYDEAFEIVKDSFNYPDFTGFIRADVVFPELKESEDEKIRKEIIQSIKDNMCVIHKDKCLAWLEKQGVQKPAGKIEPKFHEGEWITNGDYTWKIVEVKPLDYILQSQDGNIVDDTISHVDKQFHSFTIEDAKDGDVLCDYHVACNNPLIFILKKFEHVNFGLVKPSDYSSYCFLTASDRQKFKEGAYHHKRNIKPATKEQRDLLFQKMREAGYEWDAEKKELKKIEQKSAWSEEDKHRIKDAMYFLDTAKKHYASTVEIDACIDWLKSLKQRK